MKVETWDIDKLIPYAANPRKNDAAIGKVAASLKAYGFRQPIVVDSEGVIIVGHTRLKAAQTLGMTKVPVHVADLTDAEAKAYRIMDNRSSEEAEWDAALLQTEWEALESVDFDMDLLGFDDGEIDELLGDSPDFEPGTIDDQGKLDELSPKMVKCPHCSQTFDSRGHEQS